MSGTPPSEYVEIRSGGYYVAGTRVGLDVIVNDFRQGKSPEAILQAYPSIGSLAKVYGAIAFVLEHPAQIEAYLVEQRQRWNELRSAHPLPPEMIESFRRTEEEKAPRPA